MLLEESMSLQTSGIPNLVALHTILILMASTLFSSSESHCERMLTQLEGLISILDLLAEWQAILLIVALENSRRRLRRSDHIAFDQPSLPAPQFMN